MTELRKYSPDDCDVPWCHLGVPGTFAHETAKDRWPKIVNGAREDVLKTLAEDASLTEEEKEEGERIAEEISLVVEAIKGNVKLKPIPEDGGGDVASYNDELAFLKDAKWIDSPWLYTECYLYRLLHTFFSNSKSPRWKTYDIFKRQKDSTFVASKVAIEELAARYIELVKELESGRKETREEEARMLIFDEMIQISLWGNATDLSLLTNLSYEDIQKLQGKEAIKASQKNVIVNDVDEVWNHIKNLRDGRVDIVLDNSGFELYADLILTSYLLDAGYASQVFLHPKNFSWFVSDVVPSDIDSLFSLLADPNVFGTGPEGKREVIDELLKRWRVYFDQGKIKVRADEFWTTQNPYWRLRSVSPDLHSDLRNSSLVIFKGDLNYRKLVSDAKWDPLTPFLDAIGSSPSERAAGRDRWEGVTLLSLRTNKADVCVGLKSRVQLHQLEEESGGTWTRTGKYAVISSNVQNGTSPISACEEKGVENDYSLLTAILYDPSLAPSQSNGPMVEETFFLLPRHFMRLHRSLDAFRKESPEEWASARIDEEEVLKELRRCVQSVGTEHKQKISLTIPRKGGPEATSQVLPPTQPKAHSTLYKVKLDDRPTGSPGALGAHKTTRRAMYDDARARHGASLGPPPALFDVILFNSSSYVTESSIGNVALEMPVDDSVRSGEKVLKWVTPSLDCGLLAGVMREELMDRGELVEGKFTVAELKQAVKEGARLKLFNAVRGELMLELVD